MHLNDRLYEACRSGDLDTVRNLIALGIDLHSNVPSDSIRTLLRALATWDSGVDTVGNQAVYLANINKHFQVVELLKEHMK